MRATLLLLLLLAGPAHAQCPPFPLDMSGTQVADCFRAVLRPTQITAGQDTAAPLPPLTTHSALNVAGQNPPGGPWLTVYDLADYGTGTTVCVDSIESLPGGKQCGGVCALVTEGANGRAICAQSCNQKSAGTLELGTLNLATGAITALKPNVAIPFDTYGGSIPPANCELRPDGACHAYCQWARTCLTVSIVGGQLVAIATAEMRGSGPKNDPSRYDPTASTTLVGTSSYVGALPANVAQTGRTGILATAIEQQRISFTGFTVGP